jgi:GDP-4-dehydro-6-deoxy-D-mannose reductase
MRFLITGVAGFVGHHLAESLFAAGHEVFGCDRSLPSAVPAARTLDLPVDHLLECDIRERGQIGAVVRAVCPDGLFHLAAFTNPAASFHDLDSAYLANLHGSLNVFAAVHDAAIPCRVVWVGSSDAYGQVEADELPVTERNPFRPLSPYAVSKAAADLAAYQWSRTQGLDIVRVRPFNHTGPGQASHFVCAGFASQLAAVKFHGRPPRIEVGNLDVVRDFSDVRDVVRAYVAVFERGVAGEAYNVCSGSGRTPRQILERLIALNGADVDVVLDPARQRPADVPVLIGSAAKLHDATGWAPVIDWDQTLRDLLNYWTVRVSGEA